MSLRWKKALAISAAALVLILVLICVAIAALLYRYDYNRLKPYIGKSVKEATGWTLTIAGDIDVRPGLPLVLTAETLRLQRAPRNEMPPMAAAARVEVGIRLLPLLRSHLVLSRIALIEPEIHLRRDPAGKWNLIPAKKAANARANGSWSPPVVEHIQIRNGVFHYSGDSGAQYGLRLKKFDLRRKTLAQTHQVDLQGSFDAQPFRVAGTLKQLPQFFSTGETLSFDLTADSRSTQVVASGRLQPAAQQFNLECSVSAAGDTVLDVLRFCGIDRFPDFGPFRLNGTVFGPPDSLAADDIRLRAGGGDYPETRIDGRIGDLNRFREVALNFESQSSQVAAVGKVIETTLPLQGPFRVSGRFDVPAEDRYRFGDLTLALGETRLQGELELNGSVTPLQMTASLAGPRLDLRPLEVGLAAPADAYADLGPVEFELLAAAPFQTLDAEKIRLRAGTPALVALSVDGSVDNLTALRGLDLSWKIQGNRLQALAVLLGQQWPGSGAFRAAGKIRNSTSKRYRLEELSAAAAGSDLQGSAALDFSAKPIAVEASLNSRVLDLTAFIGETAASEAGNAEPSGNGPLLPAALQRLRAAVAYRAGELHLPEFTLVDLAAELALENDRLALSVRGPRLPDLLPHVAVSRLDGYRFEMEIPDTQTPSPPARFTLAAGRPETARVRIQGGSGGLPEPFPLQMDFQIEVPDPADLKALLGGGVRLPAPLEVQGRLTVSSRNRFDWRDIDARAGASELTGDLLLVLAASRPQITANLSVPILDVPSLLPPDEKEAGKDRRVPPAGLRTAVAEALQPQVRALQAVDLDAEVAFGEIRFDDFEVRELTLNSRLKAGSLNLEADSRTVPDVSRPTGIAGLPDLGPVHLELRAQASEDELALESLQVLAGSVETVRAVIQGKSRNLIDLTGSELHFRMESNDLSALKPFFGDFPEYSGAFRLEGRLENPQPRLLRLDRFELQAADSRMDGWVEFDLRRKRPEIVAELTSRRLDLVPLYVWLRPEPPVEPPPASPAADRRVLPGAPLPLDWINAVDGRLTLNSETVLLPTLTMQNFEGTVRIDDGNVLVDPCRFESGQGRFDGRTVLRQMPDGAVVSQNLRVENLQLEQSFAEMKIDPIFTGRLNAEVDLTGRGRTTGQLLGSLDGKLVALASNGRYDNRFIAPFLLDPNVRTTFLRAVNPFYKKEKYTEFNCLVNRFEFDEGVANWTGFLDTDRVYLAVGGTIDLKTERIDITATPRPKEGLGLEAIGRVTINLGELTKPFKISGTLAEPQLALAPSRAASAVGKALGGFLLLGPVGLFAAFADVSIGRDNPCVQALERFNESGAPPASGQDTDQGPLEELGEEVQELFDGEAE